MTIKIWQTIRHVLSKSLNWILLGLIFMLIGQFIGDGVGHLMIIAGVVLAAVGGVKVDLGRLRGQEEHERSRRIDKQGKDN